MLQALLIPALGLGLLSSFHCVGMCGAIAFSLPVQHMPSVKRSVTIFLYNAGRVITYGLLGLLFGIMGGRLYMSGIQQWVSMSIGIVIIITVIPSLTGSKLFKLRFINNLHAFLLKIIGRLIKNAGPGNMLVLGIANGFLPCGMVYLALAAALAVGSLKGAISFMVLFGVGTLPAMLLISYFGYRIKLSYRQAIKRTIPFFIVVIGILFVLRGMGLGIPYISPVLPAAPKDTISCY